MLVAPLDKSVPHHSNFLGLINVKAGSEMALPLSFSIGIRVVGILMLSVTILVMFLKLGQYDAEEGC